MPAQRENISPNSGEWHLLAMWYNAPLQLHQHQPDAWRKVCQSVLPLNLLNGEGTARRVDGAGKRVTALIQRACMHTGYVFRHAVCACVWVACCFLVSGSCLSPEYLCRLCTWFFAPSSCVFVHIVHTKYVRHTRATFIYRRGVFVLGKHSVFGQKVKYILCSGSPVVFGRNAKNQRLTFCLLY